MTQLTMPSRARADAATRALRAKRHAVAAGGLAALAALAAGLVLLLSDPAAAIVTTYQGEVEATTSLDSTTVHGDGAWQPGPLAGWCDQDTDGDNTDETQPYAAVRAPVLSVSSIDITVNGASACGGTLPDGDYHITIIEHAFVNKDSSTNSAGVATYDDSEIVADCNRKDAFVGGTAWYPNALTVKNGTGSASVSYGFQLTSPPNEAAGVCISHPNSNAGNMIPISVTG